MIKSFKEIRKMTKDDIFFTDYPIISLGDIPNKEAPIRPIKLVSYDRDKYVRAHILLEDGSFVLDAFKSGYVYPVSIRYGDKEHNRINKMWYGAYGTLHKILESLPITTYED